jgi:hypothetical protein
MIVWLPTTSLAKLMMFGKMWPTFESIHFIGLSLLVGAVGSFDLRLLGVAKQIPIGAFHRLVPWGVLGFGMNVVTGIGFYTASPDQYTYNPSFQLKAMFLAIAGLNILFFYTAMFRKVRTLGPGEQAPLPARIVGGVSLLAWMGVITCGRLLTFYREEHWCPWC